MESKLCATCDYWEDIPVRKGLRACLCPKIILGYGDIEVPSDGAQVEDDEGWGIITGPEFGCIHWLKKEDRITRGAPKA